MRITLFVNVDVINSTRYEMNINIYRLIGDGYKKAKALVARRSQTSIPHLLTLHILILGYPSWASMYLLILDNNQLDIHY